MREGLTSLPLTCFSLLKQFYPVLTNCPLTSGTLLQKLRINGYIAFFRSLKAVCSLCIIIFSV